MRETMKNLIKNTITSIGIALTIFCITGMVFCFRKSESASKKLIWKMEKSLFIYFRDFVS